METDDARMDALAMYAIGARALDSVRAGMSVSAVAKIIGISQARIEAAMSIAVRHHTEALFLEAYDNHSHPLGMEPSWDTFLVVSGKRDPFISVEEAASNLRGAFRSWDALASLGIPDPAERLRQRNGMRAWFRQRLPEHTGILADKDFLRVGICCWCESEYNEHELVDVGQGMIAAQCKDCREAMHSALTVKYDLVARRYADYAVECEAAYLRSVGL